MRILCVTNLFPNPLQPGKGVFNWRQLRLMSQQESVRVISPVLWTDEWRGGRRSDASIGRLAWRSWEGVDVAYCRYYYTPGIGRRYYGSYFEWSIRRMFRWAVADFQPDLVYACWAYPDGWAASRLASEFDLPLVVKVHGSDLLLLDEFPARRTGTIDLLKRADATLAVGQVLRDRAVELGAPAERAHVVREGTDSSLFCPGDRLTARRELGLRPDRRRLLFVGNLVPVKAVANLIEACRQLVAAGCDFEADILGDGPLADSLQRQITGCGLQERVHLRGRKSQNELPKWYRATDLVVLPSFSEGIPNVLVEAAACGRPFVATAVGGVPELAHFSPVPLVPPGDTMQLANAIQLVLSTPDRESVPGRRELIPTVEAGTAAMSKIFSRVIAERTKNASHGPVFAAAGAH